MSALLYHLHRPTQVSAIGKSIDVAPKIAVEKNIRAMLLKGFDVPPADDFLESRKILLANNDVHMGLAAPRNSLLSSSPFGLTEEFGDLSRAS